MAASTRRRPTPSASGEQRSLGKTAAEVVLTLLAAGAAALLIMGYLVKPYRIPSGSMLPTLHVEQRVLVNRLTHRPSVGDIVVFHPPQGADAPGGVCGDQSQGSGRPAACATSTGQESSQTFIKRVVAGPGDHLSIVAGHVIRNGTREKDGYIEPCTGSEDCNFRQTITVPPGQYFMMGDNRGASDDSRFWGPVHQDWIIGVAFFTYWPPDRIGTL